MGNDQRRFLDGNKFSWTLLQTISSLKWTIYVKLKNLGENMIVYILSIKLNYQNDYLLKNFFFLIKKIISINI